MKEKNNSLIIAVIVTACVTGGLGFVSGMKYQQSKGNSRPSLTMNAGGMGNQNKGTQLSPAGQAQGSQGAAGSQTQRGVMGGGASTGTIVTQDGDSLTIKLTDGSSKIISLSSATTVTKNETAATSDLQAGVTIMVFGTTNTDGSVTATRIQLNPDTTGAAGGAPSDMQAPPTQTQ